MADPITAGAIVTAGITAGTAVATGVGALGTWAAVGQKLRNDHKKDKNHEQLPTIQYAPTTTHKSGTERGGRIDYGADGSISVYGTQAGDRAFMSETTTWTPVYAGQAPSVPYGQPRPRFAPPRGPYQQAPYAQMPPPPPPPPASPMCQPPYGYGYGGPPPSYEQSEKKHHHLRRWKN